MERPILFNRDMVRKILERIKKMTRRPIKIEFLPGYNPEWTGYKPVFEYGYFFLADSKGEPATKKVKAPCQVGDILWVQETWKIIQLLENMQMRFEYRADNVFSKAIDFALDRFIKFKKFADKNGWQSPYFMPREAARLFLKVTGMRVERLQDITIKDIKAEGTILTKLNDEFDNEFSDETMYNMAFQTLWNSTIRKQGIDRYGWNANPYIWIIEFEVTKNGR